MSARFAELMAMSAAQTRDSDATTQRILEEKRRKDEQRKKEQLEKEKKDRELVARIARKKLEDERREEERKRKAEEDRHRKEQVTAMREAEQRKNLMYGKDRKSGWGSSGGGGGGGGGRSRKAGSDDDDDGAGTQVLTREEKRQRKLNADLNKSFTSTRRNYGSPSMQGMRRPNRTVGGGDPSHQRVSEASSSRLTETRHSQQSNGSNSTEAGNNILSVRKQLASMPPALMKLGAAKRDQRTIDEIVTDLHKKKEAKVIEGDEARRNGDWFGEQKKLGNAKKKAMSGSSLSPSPEARGSQPPPVRSKEHGLVSKTSSLSLGRTTPTSSQAPERKEPRTKVTMIKPEQGGSLSFSKTSSASTKPITSSSKASVSQSSKATTAAGKTTSAGSSLKKRGRSYSDYDSDSLDDSPPPAKRRPAASSGRNDISSEIWKLFGKDRNQYMQNDVYSDEDDDMEADADALRREEMRRYRSICIRVCSFC